MNLKAYAIAETADVLSERLLQAPVERELTHEPSNQQLKSDVEVAVKRWCVSSSRRRGLQKIHVCLSRNVASHDLAAKCKQWDLTFIHNQNMPRRGMLPESACDAG